MPQTISVVIIDSDTDSLNSMVKNDVIARSEATWQSHFEAIKHKRNQKRDGSILEEEGEG